jgi:hypothetical protein
MNSECGTMNPASTGQCDKALQIAGLSRRMPEKSRRICLCLLLALPVGRDFTLANNQQGEAL